MLGPAHQAVLQHKNFLTLWNQRDSQHFWIKTIKDHDPEVIRTLTDLAVCVHNDSKLLTPAAWSWPSRSLANLHAEQQWKIYEERDADFCKFQPSSKQLHYRDPMHYAEMLHIEGKTERKNCKMNYKSALNFLYRLMARLTHNNKTKSMFLSDITAQSPR